METQKKNIPILAAVHLFVKNRALNPEKSARTFLGICLFLFIFYFIRAWTAGDNDFLAYYNAGARAWTGESPYRLEATPYRYLPLTAFFFSPLSFFTFKTASILFFCVNFAAITAIYWQIRKRLGDLSTLLIGLLFFRFHNHDFGNAQINPILICLFLYWWKYRKESLPFSTLAFAIFASFKIIPFVFGLPLLFLGRWKELSWITLWTVTLNFLPIFFYDNGPLIFKDWYDQAKLIGYPAVMLSNIQSLQSALWWFLEGKMDVSVFGILSPLLQLSLLVGITLLFRKQEDWLIASTLAFTVLISQLAWKHNYLQFIPLAFLWFREDASFKERHTRIFYAIFLLGMVMIPSGIAAWNRTFSDRMYLMVWTGLAIIFLRYYRSKSANYNYLPRHEGRD